MEEADNHAVDVTDVLPIMLPLTDKILLSTVIRTVVATILQRTATGKRRVIGVTQHWRTEWAGRMRFATRTTTNDGGRRN